MKTFLLLGLLSVPVWAQPVLTVEAKPADALIFVDRVLRGKGSAQVTDLTPGQHLLRVSAGEDWETQQMNVKLESSPRRINVELKPGAVKWLRLGRQALSQSDWNEAIQCFQQASAARPVPAAWWEGMAQWRAGHPKVALQCFRTYAQYMPKVGQLHWILGQLNEKTNQFGPAFTAYKTAALLQPELKNALDKLPPATEANIAKLRASTTPADQLRLAQLLMLKGQMKPACDLVKPLLSEEFSKQDWLHWEPPLPAPPSIQVAPPEDQEP
ncbi:hypothetical protein ABS71_05685 [bacterium SCN 62-11]|nr:hypothetical protein [Candidatus Eremiobacteraeota bacterium]ODT74381.1 MAG: hypothetical protein ABS71_05685 [bacterium SCN 62-11]